ncbi:MAG: hypothetical protein GY722_03700, partial [bacterium]|nr:hypothetical protein [bacterium]
SKEDQQVPTILDAAERYGLSVAFVINQYGGRSIGNLPASVEYLYEQYGDHPAFFTTEEVSPHQGNNSKGLFLLLDPFSGSTSAASAGDWAAATEAIHELPRGGIVLVEATDPDLVLSDGFDGLFNPINFSLSAFDWAADLPASAWYVPTVIPGFEQRNHDATVANRRSGELFSELWEAALGTGVVPALVAVGTFNDWRNGTQIESAASGSTSGSGFEYDDYGGLGEEGYLDLTAQHVLDLDDSAVVEKVPLRITIASGSDHATAYFFEGQWVRATEHSFIGAAGDLRDIFRQGEMIGASVHQEVESAQAGDTVTLAFDVELIPGGSDPMFSVTKGCIGVVTVEVFDTRGATPTLVTEAEVPESECDAAVTFTIRLADLGIGG